jgi:hypothetical protein
MSKSEAARAVTVVARQWLGNRMPDPPGWLEKLLGSDKPSTAKDRGFTGVLKARKQATAVISGAQDLDDLNVPQGRSRCDKVDGVKSFSEGLNTEQRDPPPQICPRNSPTSSRIVDGWRWHDSGLHAARLSLLENKDSQDHRYFVTGIRGEGKSTRRLMNSLANIGENNAQGRII